MSITQTELINAIEQISAEKNINSDLIYDSLEKAIANAISKNYPKSTVQVSIDKKDGKISSFLIKTIVKDVQTEEQEISLKEAKTYSTDAKIEDKIAIEIQISALGRIAANSAKQAIFNAVRDAEKQAILDFYKDLEGTIVSGKIQKVSRGTVYIDLEKGQGEMPKSEQPEREFYEIGKRYRFLLKKLINEDNKKLVLISRADPLFIEKLFNIEIPEIANKSIEIKKIARKAGVKSKIVVKAIQEGVDAIGACVGQRGIRINNIMSELGEEKVDIIPYSEDIQTYIANCLKPAIIKEIIINEENRRIIVRVDQDSLSIAIGKEGTNAILAGEIVGYRIDIERYQENSHNNDSTSDTNNNIANTSEDKPKEETSETKDTKVETENKIGNENDTKDENTLETKEEKPKVKKTKTKGVKPKVAKAKEKTSKAKKEVKEKKSKTTKITKKDK